MADAYEGVKDIVVAKMSVDAEKPPDARVNFKTVSAHEYHRWVAHCTP